MTTTEQQIELQLIVKLANARWIADHPAYKEGT